MHGWRTLFSYLPPIENCLTLPGPLCCWVCSPSRIHRLRRIISDEYVRPEMFKDNLTDSCVFFFLSPFLSSEETQTVRSDALRLFDGKLVSVYCPFTRYNFFVTVALKIFAHLLTGCYTLWSSCNWSTFVAVALEGSEYLLFSDNLLLRKTMPMNCKIVIQFSTTFFFAAEVARNFATINKIFTFQFRSFLAFILLSAFNSWHNFLHSETTQSDKQKKN